MTLGVTAPIAHLDVRNAAAGAPREIDWDAFISWRGGRVPRFAGRYLIGSPWQWAHGEANTLLDRPDLDGDLRIIPIQRADPTRQATTGAAGERYGAEDGSAFNAAVQGCLDVGDLALAKGSVYGFLEVADETVLSPDYWRAWCSTLANSLTVSTKTLPNGIEMPILLQPLLPSILCSFSIDAASGKLGPAVTVRTALTAATTPTFPMYKETRCHAFWAVARQAAQQVPAPILDWTTFTDFRQPLPKGDWRVPVLLWRYADSPDAARPVPEIGKLTLDATTAAAGQPDPVLDATLIAKKWSAAERPVAIGVDKGWTLATEIACLASRRLTVSHLPEKIDGGAAAGPALNPELKEPARFAVRYYSAARTDLRPRRKDLQPGESYAIARAGARVVTTWQAAVQYDDVYDHLTTAGNGKEDGRNAFACAANAGQPPHTPVYFAVDMDVGPAAEPPPAYPPVASFEQIANYFAEVEEGYRLYLAENGPDAVPYRVGAYSCFTVFEVLYTRGLATHFWQAHPPRWGGATAANPRPNGKAWPHANAWQVVMADAGTPMNASGALDCQRTSIWYLALDEQVTGGTFRVFVGTGAQEQHTGALAFDVSIGELGTALRALPTWGPRVYAVEPQPTRPGFLHIFRVLFTANVDALGVDDALLVGTGANTGTEKEPAFVDIDVSWGDEGGWRP